MKYIITIFILIISIGELKADDAIVDRKGISYLNVNFNVISSGVGGGYFLSDNFSINFLGKL